MQLILDFDLIPIKIQNCIERRDMSVTNYAANKYVLAITEPAKENDLYEQYRMLPNLAKNLKFEDTTIEAFIIYDESSSPSAADYLIVADYPIETYL
jgi:hypothetical protein